MEHEVDYKKAYETLDNAILQEDIAAFLRDHPLHNPNDN